MGELVAKTPYKPLGRMTESARAELIEGALEKLGQDETLVNVAKHYGISYGLLVTALLEYAEEDWKRLQIARAHNAVNKAATKRANISAQLDEWQEMEKNGEKTPETQLTYARIREQLRLAEHDERSAQWHLERLQRRIYGQEAQADNAGRVSITLNIGAREPLDVVGGTVIDDVSKSHPSDRQE